MEIPAAYHQIDDRDDTGKDMLKFLGACAVVAILGLSGLIALFSCFS